MYHTTFLSSKTNFSGLPLAASRHFYSQVGMHSIGQLLVNNLVPVRVSEAKVGTPTVKFGKGKLH